MASWHADEVGSVSVLSVLRLKYNPALDGLRAVAIVLVFLSHAHVPMFDGAFFGVDLFFVLSGFLITSLLLKEFQQDGRLDYWRFYKRRFLRLAPALLLFLGAYWVFAPLIWPDLEDINQDVVVSALYLADYGIAFFDSPNTLLHMWSLSVEEHFYLVWPPLLALLLTHTARKQLWRPVFLLVVLMFVWRAYWVARGQQFYEIFFRFDTRATGMLLGSLLAVVSVHRPEWMDALHARQKYLLWLLPVFPFITIGYAWDDAGALLWGFALAELTAVAIVIAVSKHKGALYDMLSLPLLVWLGKMSYGIYLWHYPVVRLLRAHMDWAWVVALGLPLSAAFAALSFYTVERWALHLRDRVGRGAPSAHPVATRQVAQRRTATI
ncbi:acyltransferase [Comamonas testosteroni]